MGVDEKKEAAVLSEKETAESGVADIAEQESDTEFDDGSVLESQAESKTAISEAEEGSPATTTTGDLIDSVFAKARRETSTKEDFAKARERGILEATGGINPYTHEEMKDTRDIQEFLLMRKIEKAGDDPITDYSKWQKKEQREADKAQMSKGDFQDDIKAFIESHSDIDINKLATDKRFTAFSRGRLGKDSFSEIYDDYIEFVNEYEKEAKQKAQRFIAKSKASPGSLAGGGNAPKTYYSMETMRAMSQEEVDANYDKVRESLAYHSSKKK